MKATDKALYMIGILIATCILTLLIGGIRLDIQCGSSYEARDSSAAKACREELQWTVTWQPKFIIGLVLAAGAVGVFKVAVIKSEGGR